MPIPGWAPSSGDWTTPLPGWPRPAAPPDYDAINEARLARSITVSLNGFTASNVDKAGTREEISLEAVEGWWDPVGDRTESIPHPRGDGDVSFRLLQGGRVITVSGMIETDYQNADASRLLTLMDDVTAQTRSGTLLVQEHLRGMMREADVRRLSLQMTPLGHAHAVFTLVFSADDPIRYGSGVRTLPRNVAVGVQNPGDAPRTNPILEWTGAATNPGVNFGTLNWRLGENTAAGDKMLVNCRDGTVFKNGSQIFPAWTGIWPYTSPVNTFQFTAVGTSMTMRRAAGWS